MKIKKASIFSLVLALALVVGVTTAFATSAANAAEQDTLALDSMEYDNSKIKGINLADSDNSDGLVQIVGGQTYDEHEVININDLNSTDATSILKNAQLGELTLRSVSHDDERKFTPEEWAKILDLIDEGKVFWED